MPAIHLPTRHDLAALLPHQGTGLAAADRLANGRALQAAIRDFALRGRTRLSLVMPAGWAGEIDLPDEAAEPCPLLRPGQHVSLLSDPDDPASLALGPDWNPHEYRLFGGGYGVGVHMAGFRLVGPKRYRLDVIEVVVAAGSADVVRSGATRSQDVFGPWADQPEWDGTVNPAPDARHVGCPCWLNYEEADGGEGVLATTVISVSGDTFTLADPVPASGPDAPDVAVHARLGIEIDSEAYRDYLLESGLPWGRPSYGVGGVSDCPPTGLFRLDSSSGGSKASGYGAVTAERVTVEGEAVYWFENPGPVCNVDLVDVDVQVAHTAFSPQTGNWREGDERPYVHVVGDGAGSCRFHDYLQRVYGHKGGGLNDGLEGHAWYGQNPTNLLCDGVVFEDIDGTMPKQYSFSNTHEPDYSVLRNCTFRRSLEGLDTPSAGHCDVIGCTFEDAPIYIGDRVTLTDCAMTGRSYFRFIHGNFNPRADEDLARGFVVRGGSIDVEAPYLFGFRGGFTAGSWYALFDGVAVVFAAETAGTEAWRPEGDEGVPQRVVLRGGTFAVGANVARLAGLRAGGGNYGPMTLALEGGVALSGEPTGGAWVALSGGTLEATDYDLSGSGTPLTPP